jgi:peptidoglycan/LPS O-acetylase OafA/YrhL
MKSRALTNRPTYFPLLDLFRALAAFLVVLEHARNYLWIDFPEIVHPSVLIKALYFLSQFGHQAVMLFSFAKRMSG